MTTMTETKTILINVAPRFAMDHSDRDLETGREVCRSNCYITYEVNVSELREWLSDARFYSDCAGQGWTMHNAGGLQSSARATVKSILKTMQFYLIDRPLNDSTGDRIFVEG